MKIYHLLTLLETVKRGWLMAFAIGAVILLGLGDYYTGFELSFSFFYLIPVTMTAWALGRESGLSFSVLSAAVWLTSNLLSGREFSHPAIEVWNTLIRFGFFSVVTILLTELHNALEEERLLANTDPLTGALNRRSFNELAEKRMIMAEVNRRPYALVYLDLDNFKTINDVLGHAVGDLVLKTAVDTLRGQIRNTDFLARLGGDEFAVMLEDIDPTHVANIVQRWQAALLETMAKNRWEITFSIGVMTVLSLPESVDKLVSLTDALMYEVKRKGKNAIEYAVFES